MTRKIDPASMGGRGGEARAPKDGAGNSSRESKAEGTRSRYIQTNVGQSKLDCEFAIELD